MSWTGLEKLGHHSDEPPLRTGYTDREKNRMSLKRKPPVGNVRRVAAIGKNIRGTLTNKTGRIVQFESFAERSLLLRLERDNRVADYASQPETFEAGKNTPRYTPDFIVWKQDNRVEIHEVTRSERRTRENQQCREQLATRICQERGWQYIVHTEDALPQGAELSNLLSLLRYRPHGYEDAAILSAARSILQNNHQMRLETLTRLLVEANASPLSTVAASLCHYLWHEQLITNWQHPILSEATFSPQACVWLPNETMEIDA